MNTEEFIKKSQEKYGDKYDYSKTIYNGSLNKVTIICHKKDENGKEHGEFQIIASEHIRKNRECGCPICSKEEKTYNLEEIKEKSKNIYGDKYDVIKRDGLFITFKCNVHNCINTKKLYPYLQGTACKQCGTESRFKKLRSNKEEFIEKAKNVYGDKYDYSKVEYVNSKTDICILCKKHGEFNLTPNEHLSGEGCPKCGKESMSKKRSLGKEEFIKRAKKVHGNKYDYSKVEYKNNRNRVIIICSEHGEFKQAPYKHLIGQGCPDCKKWLLENEISKFFIEEKIRFKSEKKFPWTRNKRYDFYLPEYNIAIECQGKQHFVPKDFFGGEEGLINTQKSDKEKFIKANENGIKIYYYIPYFQEVYNISPDFYKKNNNVFTNINELKSILQKNE